MIESTIYEPLHAVMDDLLDLRNGLVEYGCKACTLGFQEGLNGCCVARGNPESRRMIIGEAPGKYEDAQSLPFVGPAGQLMNQIFGSVDFNMDTDWYITNIVLCRPIAPKGSGKENYTPRMEQRNKCRPFLDAQLRFIQPRIIVTIGLPATEAILKQFGYSKFRMGDFRGQLKTHNFEGIGEVKVFPMLHPAAILHAKSQPEKHQLYREQTWEDIQRLRQIIDEEGL